MKSSDEVRFFLDENLPRKLTSFLEALEVPIGPLERGIGDDEVVRRVGVFGHRGVWVTQDLAARDDHRTAILESGISVAWLHSGSGPPLKAAFLALSFLYRFWTRIEESKVPLYFDVKEVGYPRGPSAVVYERRDL